MKDKLQNLTNHSYTEFEKVFLKELNKPTPLKKKILRHGNAFMTKELRKEIMLRSKLKIKFDKERNHINWCHYKRQCNHCLRPRNTNTFFSKYSWNLIKNSILMIFWRVAWNYLNNCYAIVCIYICFLLKTKEIPQFQ